MHASAQLEPLNGIFIDFKPKKTNTENGKKLRHKMSEVVEIFD